MRGLVQRVERAAVDVVDAGDSGTGVAEGHRRRVGEIGPGLCVLVGVTHTDGEQQAVRLADKLAGLRILDDADGVMNKALTDRLDEGRPAEILIVSQFTLYGNTDKGRRPSWIDAARPEHAEPLIDQVVRRLRELGLTVATGQFRTDMRVDLVNDGPVTVLVEVD